MPDRPLAYITPVFDAGDPLITRSVAMRPSLWAVVFAHIEQLTHDWSWRQGEPGGATVQEVTHEFFNILADLEVGMAMYIGEVREFATADPPAGWLRCDGATYENVDYPLLAAAINPGLVVDADHFRVPDRDRRIGVDGFDVGLQGGAATHTLTIAEMPSHDHAYVEAVVAPSVVLGELPGFELGDTVPSVTDTSGGGGAHNNMQPYEGSQFYIRAEWPTAGV